MTGIYRSFINQYPLSKTIRFRLIPQFETQHNLNINSVIEKDEQVHENYLQVRKILSDFDREFIKECLNDKNYQNDLYLNWKDLGDAYANKAVDSKAYANETKKAIQKIVDIFSERSEFKDFFKEKIFSSKKFLSKLTNEEKEVVKRFKGFTTYLVKYNENRKNIFSNEAKSTSVAYRIAVDNFQKYYRNVEILGKIKDKLSEDEYTEISEQLMKINGSFNSFISQEGIDEYNILVSAINSFFNQFSQQNKDKKIGKVKLENLYNLMLSEKSPVAFLSNIILDDNDLLNSLNDFAKYRNQNDSVFSNIGSFITSYISNRENMFTEKGVNDISNKIFNDYSKIKMKFIQDTYAIGNKKEIKSAEKKKEYSISDILTIIESLDPTKIPDFNSYCNAYIEAWKDIDIEENEVLELNETDSFKMSSNKIIVSKIKSYLDSVNSIQRFFKSFHVDEGNGLYGQYVELLDNFNQFTFMYNKVRNYLTKKDFDSTKLKLNFGAPTIGSGWDVNKESSSLSIILRKEGTYYLGIYNKADKPKFPKSVYGAGYEKMEMKYGADVVKMFPKCIFTKAVKEHFIDDEKEDFIHKKSSKFNNELIVTRELFDCYKGKMMNKEYQDANNSKEARECLKKYIQLCIDFTKTYKNWSVFDFSHIKQASDYTTIVDFYNDVQDACYSVKFISISEEYIRTIVKEDKMYLFKIYNKDFAPEKKGADNMHTLYFKALFDDYNKEAKVFQIGGAAEFFWRKKSINDVIKHRKGSILVNKTDVDGNTLDETRYNEIYKFYNNKLSREELSDGSKSLIDNKSVVSKVAKYDIVKDRRYTEDQFFFHLSVKLNAKARGKGQINNKVKNEISKVPLNIIGVDRGERNLIYISAINEKGIILEQKSFNMVSEMKYDGTIKETNYHDKLSKRNVERDTARKNWDTIGTIKELKEGYLSQVIHQITSLMIKYDAILVMEDLNYGFKRSRVKFESQVYQKFENMLISKLNYLALKDKESNEVGSVYHAYQLSNSGEAITKSIKQSGFIFYVDAKYTSKIDPTTGFADLFKHRVVELKINDFINKFDNIRYDENKNLYYYEFSYGSFKENECTVNTGDKKWRVYICGERVRIIKKQNHEIQYEYISLQDELMRILNQHGGSNCSIKDIDLRKLEVKDVKKYYSELYYLYKLAVQLRNYSPRDDEDYIISPVINSEGEFFDSRRKISFLPVDADANGAYNIALKGLIVKGRIDKDPNDKKLYIETKDWFDFIQGKLWKNT